MTGTEIYKRTATYEKEAGTIRLHAPQWKLLLAFDGVRTLAEVALSADITFAEALPLTEKYLASKWIEEQPITLEQYLKRTGAPDISAIGASVPPAVVLHQPRSAPATPPPIPVTVATPVATPILAATPPPLVPKVIPAPPAPAVVLATKTSHGPMRLGEVVDYITSLVGNTALGQLLVYRVFLQVPPELLQAEDIASIRLVNDPSLVRGEALQRAIIKAVSDVAKHALPDGVFAPA